MKTKYLTIMLIILGTVISSSCKKEDLFEQPTVEVTGYSLLELPGVYTYLEIDMLVTNNDTREVHIADVEYEVIIEGVTSEVEFEIIDQEMLTDTPLELSLPLTFVTADAIQLLAKLEAGGELQYGVTGTFHVDDPILNLFDLPINVMGTASLDVGIEDFYEQPVVEVDDIRGDYTANGTSGFTFEFEVDCFVQNIDSRGVVIDEIEYIVYIEGIPSETHLYSDSYDNDFAIDGKGSKYITLPVTLNLSTAEGAILTTAIGDGTIDYKVEGTFHAIEVDGTTTDFILPLYINGEMDAAGIVEDLFEQPEVTVNDITGTYQMNGIIGYTFDLEIDCTVENIDSRDVVIDEVEYVVTVEGVESDQHLYTNAYPTDFSIVGGGTESLILPLTMNLDAAEGATLYSATLDGSIDYVIEGTIHVVAVDGIAVDLLLPLYATGTLPASSVGL